MPPDLNERPESLLKQRLPSASTWAIGTAFAVSAHLLIPGVLLASQWLLVLLGLAIPSEERVRPKLPMNMIAAEFVKLGKPFDPTKLPNRKVPPIAKRKPTGVVVSPDARESTEKPEEEKDKPPDAQDSLLDNLVDRTKEFAEDVPYEQEGDPMGVPEGTATTAQAGNIFLGQLALFLRRGWEVPNLLTNPEKLRAIAAITIAEDGRVTAVEITRSSGEPLFDQSVVDRVQALIQAGAKIPEPPPEFQSLLGNTNEYEFNGKDAR